MPGTDRWRRVGPLHCPQVDRDLVDHDEGRLAAEQLAEGFGTGGDVFFITLLSASVTLCAGQAIGQLAPKRLGEQAGLAPQQRTGAGALPEFPVAPIMQPTRCNLIRYNNLYQI